MSNHKPEIKESLSGAFLVKLGSVILGGFYKREHAELFLKAYNKTKNDEKQDNQNQDSSKNTEA